MTHDPPLINLSETCATVSSTEPAVCVAFTNAAQPSNINIITTQGGEEDSVNPTAILKQCITNSSSSLADRQAYPSANPQRPSALAKLDQASGTILDCPEKAKGSANPFLEANLKEDQSVSEEAGASWQALQWHSDSLSSRQTGNSGGLLNVLAVHIVSINKKL
ncbi:hypothetical protein NDU88_004301 [Pleurodeles waltl]|uniref:Uncharacterized protein n=1 Tax=Pleurodeles waltl TaxID=8319 RepID=A0AAV7PC25_PLEWA|nr:hypothetical protein NDU88_004301 [Pleurodeles waltl]